MDWWFWHMMNFHARKILSPISMILCPDPHPISSIRGRAFLILCILCPNRFPGILALFLFLLQFQDVAHSRDPVNFDQWKTQVSRAEKRYGESWSVYVEDLESGKTIFEYNPAQKLIPASNRKLMIFGLALDTLGPDFQFKTELFLDQGQQEGVTTYQGNLVMFSNGDPTMDAAYMPGINNPVALIEEWCRDLASKGIQRIGGDLVIDASAFGSNQNEYPAVWDARHRGYAYASIPSAIAISKNLLSLIVKPGGSSGDPGEITVFPSRTGIRLNNRTVTRKRKPHGVTAVFGPNNQTINLKGKVRLRGRNEVAVLPLQQPLEYIGLILKHHLADAGIQLDGNVRIVLNRPADHQNTMDKYVVGSHESPPLHKLLRTMLSKSNNFIAEQVWRACAVRAVGKADSFQVRDVEQDWLRQKGLSWINPGYDGCGLSPLNRFSPVELVLLLKKIYHSAYKHQLVSALPVSGRSGTLKQRSFTRTGGRVSAKTGTLTGATSLTGLIRDRKKKFRYVFSVIGNAKGDTHGRLNMRINQLLKVSIRKLDKSSAYIRPNSGSGKVSTRGVSLKKADSRLKKRLKAWLGYGGRIIE
jgi:D-alanyl-D-alanine carboxypeptidase/D-alanyl-D-alanine-endopeptidase (penicillin-binding protein 4)